MLNKTSLSVIFHIPRLWIQKYYTIYLIKLTRFPACPVYKMSETIACTIHIFLFRHFESIDIHTTRILLFFSENDFIDFLSAVVSMGAFASNSNQIEFQLKYSIAVGDFP